MLFPLRQGNLWRDGATPQPVLGRPYDLERQFQFISTFIALTKMRARLGGQLARSLFDSHQKGEKDD